MALKMLGMNALVKIKERKNKTDGGIYIPETADSADTLEEAVVLNIGPGEYQGTQFVDTKPLIIGDTVIIDKSFAKPLKYNGEKCWVVSFKDILGVDHEKEDS